MRRRKTPRRKKGRKHVQSNKVSVDGINFASGLEAYMYRALKKEKLFDKYEGEKFELLEGFYSDNLCWERQSNGKGEFRQRNVSKIRGITYTPDFTGEDYIIETKGRANESFPLRWKLFKSTLHKLEDKRRIYKPQTQKECDEVVRLILESRQ